MKFTYKNNEYELIEMVEPYTNKIHDMLSIFRIRYVIIDKNFNKIEVGKNDEYDFEDYEYINYFCNQDDINENLKIAQSYIDEWIEQKTKTQSTLEQAIELLKIHFMIDESFMDPCSKEKWINCINSLEKIKDGE